MSTPGTAWPGSAWCCRTAEDAAGRHAAVPVGAGRRPGDALISATARRMPTATRAPLGKVGLEVTEEQAFIAARLTGLAIPAAA